MPSIINVLIGSFRLLRRRPELFVPKLISTAIGALWFIGLVSGTGSMYFYAATGPVLVLVAVFVSVMLASMVRNRDSGNILRKGWSETVERSDQLLVSTLALFLVSMVVYVPLVIGLMLQLFYGSYIAFLAGAALTGILVLVFGFLVYFFPISLLEKDSVIEGFRDSAKTSMGNSPEVLLLTLLSFVLLVLASVSGDQGMRYAGYAGFFALRMVSGVFTTYIFVVSPEYYLSD